MGEGDLSIIRGAPLDDEEGVGALTLGGWLREVCERFGPNEALVLHEDGQRISWTYLDLWERANEVARALHACGIGKGERVGVLMTNRPEFLSAVFGVALAGGTSCTLSTFSTQPELEYLLQLSGASILLVERQVLKKDFCEMLADIEPAVREAKPGELSSVKLPFLRRVAAIGGGPGMVEKWNAFLRLGDGVDPALIDATAASVTPADPGALFFSSGSTAKPKGIINSQRGMALQLWRLRRFFQTGSDARTWSANGYFWSGNFTQAIGGTMSAGGALVLQKTFDPEEALEIIEREKATMLIAWPHQWPQLTAAPNFEAADLSSLKYVDPKYPIAQHPSVDVSWPEPTAAYGNTETFTISSIFESGTPAERVGGSAGEPQPGISFKIVDPLSGATLPIGERGEIAVKGPTLMMGYVGVPLDETLDDEGYFRTGDGGYVDRENRLFWEGRLNDIIKTGGANVSPLEIDAVIRECPGVKVCLTVGVPHDTLGELVVTCVVPKSGANISEQDVRSFTREHLASYKVPRRVLFVDESDLETTGTNKLKTADMRKLASEKLETEDAG